VHGIGVVACHNAGSLAGGVAGWPAGTLQPLPNLSYNRPIVVQTSFNNMKLTTTKKPIACTSAYSQRFANTDFASVENLPAKDCGSKNHCQNHRIIES